MGIGAPEKHHVCERRLRRGQVVSRFGGRVEPGELHIVDDADDLERSQLLTAPDSSRWSWLHSLAERVLVGEIVLHKRLVNDCHARMILIVLRRKRATLDKKYANRLEVIWSHRNKVGRQRAAVRRHDAAFDLERVEPV